MIDFESILRVLRRARSSLTGIVIALAILAAAMMFVDVPSLVHAQDPASAASANGPDRSPPRGTTPEEVAGATRGKAVFRTLRLTAPKPMEDTGRFSLTGASMRGGEAIAFIRDAKLNRTFTVKVGENLASQFEIVAIHKDSVEMKRGGDIVVLRRR